MKASAMTLQEKRAYLKELRKRYQGAERTLQSKILDEFCAICGYHRKYAIRLIHKAPHKKKKKPGHAIKCVAKN